VEDAPGAGTGARKAEIERSRAQEGISNENERHERLTRVDGMVWLKIGRGRQSDRGGAERDDDRRYGASWLRAYINEKIWAGEGRPEGEDDDGRAFQQELRGSWECHFVMEAESRPKQIQTKRSG